MPAIGDQFKKNLSEVGVRVDFVIQTSRDLPEKFKEKLHSLCGREAVVESDVGESIRSVIEKHVSREVDNGECYCTLRMDDDALSKNFSEHVFKYLDPRYEGVFITAASGVNVVIDDAGNVEFCSNDYKPKIALGLMHVGVKGMTSPKFNVYSSGAHMSLDSRYPVILDAKEVSWARTVHFGYDQYSNEDMRKRHRSKGNPPIFSGAQK